MRAGGGDRVAADLAALATSELEDFQDQVVVFILNFPFFVQILLEMLGSQMSQLGGGWLLLVDHALNIEKRIQMALVLIMVASKNVRLFISILPKNLSVICRIGIVPMSLIHF